MTKVTQFNQNVNSYLGPNIEIRGSINLPLYSLDTLNL